MKKVLMTGATGFMGRVFARDFLAKYPDAELWALVRPSNGKDPARRPELKELVGNPRFHVLPGDITSPGLGLDGCGAGLPTCENAFDACFHFAAETEFKEIHRERTFRVNLDGTKNLIVFLKSLPKPPRLYHISTTYVSWQGKEVIKEELLPEGPHANPYEESKHRAEEEVAGSGLDAVILRVSILVGDSRTGEAISDKMAYGVLKTYWRFKEVLLNKYSKEELKNLTSEKFVIQSRREIARNFLCLDDCIRLLLAVIQARPASGAVFHLANPNTTTMDEFHKAIFDVLDLRCVAPQVELPHEMRSEERLLQRGLHVYLPYMTLDEPRFDLTNLRFLLGDEVVDSIAPPTPELLRFLFHTHVREHLEAAEIEEPAFDRLPFVRRYGRHGLAYSSLNPHMQAIPLDGGKGYISYALKGRTAMMIGDPVTAIEDFPQAVEEFFAHCEKHSLRPAAGQISCAMADILITHGGYANRMGDDAYVFSNNVELPLRGKRWEHVRTWINSSRNHGVMVKEATYQDIPYEIVDRVSRSWLETKINKRELEVLLRPLPQSDELDVRKFFAFQGETLVGFVIFDPLYENEEIIGYYADIERYMRHPNGIHDLILLEAIKAFKAEGKKVLSLGLAPLYHLELEDHPSSCALTRELLTRICKEVGPVYNFQGVSKHKTYYNPVWEPTYFYSTKNNGASDLLDLFTLVGLCPPEVLRCIRYETFDMVRD